MTDKFWMVINVASTEDVISQFSVERVDRDCAPRVCWFYKSDAEQETLRLAQKVPAGEFVLLEAIAEARQIQPGHYRLDDIQESAWRA